MTAGRPARSARGGRCGARGAPTPRRIDMKSIPTNSPANVAVLDEKDPNAGGACHLYAIQYGGPSEICRIQFQHGPRGVHGSIAGVFDDDLLAIVQSRLEAFQEGPFACSENADALLYVKVARDYLSLRVARRLAKGVLGLNENH